jgi:hypothetical protein
MLIMINETWLLEPYFLLGRRPLLSMSGRQLDCPAGRAARNPVPSFGVT